MTMTQTSADSVPPQAPADHRPAWRQAPIFPIFWIWVGLTALLTLFALFVPARLMGPPASSRMREVESTVTSFSVASAPVAALVWAVVLYSLIAWRHKGSEMPTESGPPLRQHQKLQIVWIVVSTVLCLFLLIWGLILLAPPSSSQADSGAPPMVVNVTGQQWSWSFEYPGNGGVQSDTLYLPINQHVVFHVSSKDVIHSFWITQMAVKIDANPGATTVIDVTPDKLGTFSIRCAELCGLYHAYMQTTVHVVSASDFQAWVQASSQGSTS